MKVKTIVGIALSCLICTFGQKVSVWAAPVQPISIQNQAVMPRYTSIKTVRGELTIENGLASFKARVIPKENVLTTVACNLQRKTSSGTWETIKTWREAGSGLSGASVSGSYYVERGYYYRVFVSGSADRESATYTTSSVYCD